MSRKIAITELDKQRLEKLINDIIQQNLNGREHIRILRNELNNADIISSKQIPSDIITMNSEVLLSVGDTGEEKVYSLVYPENADFLNNKISVLAPIGTAILGYKEEMKSTGKFLMELPKLK